jgi:hypothetical protein
LTLKLLIGVLSLILAYPTAFAEDLDIWPPIGRRIYLVDPQNPSEPTKILADSKTAAEGSISILRDPLPPGKQEKPVEQRILSTESTTIRPPQTKVRTANRLVLPAVKIKGHHSSPRLPFVVGKLDLEPSPTLVKEDFLPRTFQSLDTLDP